MYFFVQGIGDSISGLFTRLIIIAIIGIISLLGWITYGFSTIMSTIMSSDEQVIEASHRITPTFKLHTDGKTVDTIYIYTYKK